MKTVNGSLDNKDKRFTAESQRRRGRGRVNREIREPISKKGRKGSHGRTAKKTRMSAKEWSETDVRLRVNREIREIRELISSNRRRKVGAARRPYTAKVGRSGQKTGSFRMGIVGKRAEVGKGGRKIGKWTGFSHFETALTRLFPHVTTQVVDFPHMYAVRVFGRVEEFAAEASRCKDKRNSGGTWGGCGRLVRIFVGKVTGFYAKVRESPRKFAQIRPVNPRCYAFLRVGPIFLPGKT